MSADSTKPCAVYEGCGGQGWRWDPEDSGSGRQVYCDCKAGLELKRKDAVDMAVGFGVLR